MVEKKSSFGFKQFLLSPVGKFAMIAILYFVVMGLIYLTLAVFENASFVAVIMAVFLAYFGWQALSKITPNLFLIMPVGGWIAYYVVKGVLSFFLGVFVAPFVISRKIVKSLEESLS